MYHRSVSPSKLLHPVGRRRQPRVAGLRGREPRSSLAGALHAATTSGGSKWFDAGLTRTALRSALAELRASYLRLVNAPAAEGSPQQVGRLLLEHPVGVRCWYTAWRVTTRSLQPHDREEVLQEGIARFLQDFSAGKGQRYIHDRGCDAFSAWLYLVWKRRFLTLVSARGKAARRTTPLTPQVEEALESPGGSDDPFAAEDARREVERVRAALDAVLSQLDPKYNHPELWLASWSGETTWKDLARACGVEPSYVSRLRPKVLRWLRDCLKGLKKLTNLSLCGPRRSAS